MAQTAAININVNSKQAQADVDKLSGSIGSAAGSSATLRLELRKTIEELQNLEPGTARFRELSLRAGELRDQIDDTNTVVGQLAGNLTERLTRGITGVVQVGVAGFQAISAGVALFGSESEELNKTLVKLTALINLSQALETFAGLDQKLVEIRASFQSLTTATEAQAVAETENAVATEVGTVATSGLGLAMKALPIIALIAGIGALIAGIYSYVNASEEADKQEKIRKKNLENLKKEQKEQVEFIGKESSEFASLITQLKATNEGSKRRSDLIKQINSEYGTTLKNLDDEKAFQSLLNAELEDYIELQRQKYTLQKNDELIQRNLTKQEEIRVKIRKQEAFFQGQVNAGTRKSFEDALFLGGEQTKLYRSLQKELSDAEKRLLNYGGAANNANTKVNNLTNGGKKFVTQTKDTKDTLDDTNESTDKYATLLADIQDKLTRQANAEKELEDAQIERITNAQEREIKTLEKQFGDERTELIEGAIAREIAAFEEKFKEEGNSEEDYIKGVEAIRAKGAENLLDIEKKLLEEKKNILDEGIQDINDSFDLESQITQQAITQIQDESRLLQIQFAKEQELKEIESSTLTEEKKQEAILDVKRKYLDEEVKLIELSAKNQINAVSLQKQKQLEDEQLTADQRKQIEEKYNQDVLKISQDTQDKIQDAVDGTKDVQKTALEELQEQVEKVQEYLDLITGLYNQFSDTVSMISQSRTKQREAEVEGLFAFEKEALENQLAEGLVSREQYDNSLAELDQQREQQSLAIKRQEFETNKKLNMANAVINGAQAVLQALASSAPPLNFILAALVGGMAAVQFGIISSEEFTAAGGGIVPGMGSGMVDSVPAMLAPGETVINAQSSAMYPELLNSINTAGGGISLKPDLPAVNKTDGEMRVFGDNKVNQPIRAYVVETDVTDTQKRVDRIKRSAEF